MEETSEEGEEDDDEASINKTDLKWIHKQEDGDDGLEADDVVLIDPRNMWLFRLSVLINGCFCTNIMFT